MANRSGNGQTPAYTEDKKRVNWQQLKEALGIFRFILPHKWYFFAAIVVLFLGIFTTMAFPYFLGELVNIASPGAAIPGTDVAGAQVPAGLKAQLNAILPKDINQIAILLVVILFAQAFLSFCRFYFSEQVSQRAMADIRLATYRRLITFPIHFFEQRRVGELTSRLSSDVTQLQDILSFTLFEFLRQVLVLVVGLVILFALVSSKLTLFMLSIIPLVVLGAMVLLA